MEHREFKNNVYGLFAQTGKVLSSPRRIELLDLLSQGPMSVELLAKETKMNTANTSKHLQALLDARLVRFHKEKNHVIYHLACKKVIDLMFSLRELGEEQLAELNVLRNEYIVRPDHLDTVEEDELRIRMKAEDTLLIDVRPAAEFEAGHIPGAISVPLEEMERFVSEFPKDKEIAAYCRGPYCVYATEAVEMLQSKGFKASRLESGVHEWEHEQERHAQH